MEEHQSTNDEKNQISKCPESYKDELDHLYGTKMHSNEIVKLLGHLIIPLSLIN